jgi:hypothetical protein
VQRQKARESKEEREKASDEFSEELNAETQRCGDVGV